jgi:hypothetical protein
MTQFKTEWVAGLALCLALQLPMSAAWATEDAGEDQWIFAGELFALGASVEGRTNTGEDIDVPLNDVLDNLDFAFMGTLAAQKNRWTLFADFIYADVGEKDRIPVEEFPQLEADVKLDLKQFTSTFGGAYRVYESGRGNLSLLAGGRYLSIDADLDLRVDPILDERFSDSGSNWDFIVGARGMVDLNERWYLHYYADIGTGDSDRTWQALAGINYRFSKVHATLGYAYLDWDFEKDSLVRDLTLKGPYVGLKFRF